MTVRLIFGDDEVKKEDGFIIKVVEKALYNVFANNFARRSIFLGNPKLLPHVTGGGPRIWLSALLNIPPPRQLGTLFYESRPFLLSIEALKRESFSGRYNPIFSVVKKRDITRPEYLFTTGFGRPSSSAVLF